MVKFGSVSRGPVEEVKSRSGRLDAGSRTCSSWLLFLAPGRRLSSGSGPIGDTAVEDIWGSKVGVLEYEWLGEKPFAKGGEAWVE